MLSRVEPLVSATCFSNVFLKPCTVQLSSRPADLVQSPILPVRDFSEDGFPYLVMATVKPTGLAASSAIFNGAQIGRDKGFLPFTIGIRILPS